MGLFGGVFFGGVGLLTGLGLFGGVFFGGVGLLTGLGLFGGVFFGGTGNSCLTSFPVVKSIGAGIT